MLSDCQVCQPLITTNSRQVSREFSVLGKPSVGVGRWNTDGAICTAAGSGIDDELTKSPQLRVLAVYTHVVHNGPVSLSHVARGLSLPTSSVSRALSKLERCGWVRRCATDRLFQVTSAFQSMVSKARFLDDRWAEVDKQIDRHVRAFGGNYRLAAFDSRHHFVPVGGNWDQTLPEREDMFFTPLSAAAMSGVGDRQFEVYLSANASNAAHAHLEKIAVFKSWMQRHVENAVYVDDNFAFIPLSLSPNVKGAVQIYRGTMRDFRVCVEKLRVCIENNLAHLGNAAG